MLTSLIVKNFTLVDHLEVDFLNGMTAITGETGAGKSLVLDALGMALGDRADSDRIRRPADRAEIAAHFDTDANPEAGDWLRDNDFDQESGVLLRRIFTVEGRSRGYINGQPATMQQLQQLGELLIDIHSQHEHQSLLKKDSHAGLLDAFGGHADLATQVARLYRDWRRLANKLEDLEARAEDINARRQMLGFQVEELDQLALSADELPALEREQHLLANAEHILRDSHQLLALCSDGEAGDLTTLLNRCLQLLGNMPEKTARLEEAEKLLDGALIQVQEASWEIRHHIESFDLNPERLQEVEQRLSAIYQLSRKHRVRPEDLCDHYQQLAAELADLGGGEAGLDNLRRQVHTCAQALADSCDHLSRARQQAAARFTAAVNAQLDSLAMGGATMQVDLAAAPQPGVSGAETVEFLVSTNPGQPHRPLGRIVSGGELSRISLAIQVIAADNSRIPTLVFDEVDVGIGGAVAEVVGRLLRRLGDNGQVICVTHLAQVASCAHQHMSVSKTSDGERAESSIRALSAPERVEEIARMLGGARITAQTRAHAEEMLALTDI